MEKSYRLDNTPAGGYHGSNREKGGVVLMDTRTKKKLGVWLSVAGILLVLEGFVFAGGLGVLIAAWYRIKEINGGEEDDLSQY